MFCCRNGSVIADFSIGYREISTVEVIALASYLDEKKLLGSMPVGYSHMNISGGKTSLVYSILYLMMEEVVMNTPASNFVS